MLGPLNTGYLMAHNDEPSDCKLNKHIVGDTSPFLMRAVEKPYTFFDPARRPVTGGPRQTPGRGSGDFCCPATALGVVSPKHSPNLRDSKESFHGPRT